MDPKIKAQWTNALRSGKYEQGEGALRYLADFIESLRDDQIYMPGYDCDTAKCALGWAVTLPELRAMGVPSDPDTLHQYCAEIFGMEYPEPTECFLAIAYRDYDELEIPASAVAHRLREAADNVARREDQE